MWRAKCVLCDFTALQDTRDEAAMALVAHIHDTGHQFWVLVPIGDSQEPPAEDE